MSMDVVAVATREPDEEAIAGALMAAGPELWMAGGLGGGVIRLLESEGGRLVVFVETPILIRVPGELERLLGPAFAHLEPPVWWVEVRAMEDVEGAEVAAVRFAAELSLRLEGEVWMDDPGYALRAGLRSR
jgi:hypothetical protein